MRLRVVLTAGAALLALAGCGGGGDGGSAPTPAEFRQQADAICKEFEQKLDALGSPSSPDDLAEFVDRAVPIIEDGNERLRALEPPNEFADDWARVMELQEQNLETTRDLQEAIRENDTARAQALLAELGPTNEESTRLARKLGLEQCGQNE